MAIRRAEVLGFCGGVKRAIIMVEQAVLRKKHGKKLQTIGPLIHNKAELDRLSGIGLETISSVDDVSPNAEVLIRAHGAPIQHYQQLRQQRVPIVEGICPIVRDARNKIIEFSKKGYFIVLAGEEHHAEVLGLISFAEQGCVISSIEQAQNVELPQKSMLLSQSTWPPEMFQKVCAILQKRYPDLTIEDTVCSATMDRQQAVRRLLPQVEALVIVGDRMSSNTLVLYQIGVDAGIPTWLCSNVDDVPAQLAKYKIIGLSAGASAPDWLIDEIEQQIGKLSDNQEEEDA